MPHHGAAKVLQPSQRSKRVRAPLIPTKPYQKALSSDAPDKCP